MTYPTLEHPTEHVYWLPPSKPDRPSLTAVVGIRRTLMLDVGASPAHTGRFLDLLSSLGVRPPDLAVLTHGHWDHVFGIAKLDVPVIAHAETAAQLARLRAYEWSDEALDVRVAAGVEIEPCARDIKLELPSPREVTLRSPDLIFSEGLELSLGEVDCSVLHVGGDHAEDACIIHVMPDRLVFLGDCLYEAIYAPVRHYTTDKLFPLLDTVLALDANLYVEGHTDTLMTRAELLSMARKMRFAGKRVMRGELDMDEVQDEDTKDFLRAFMAGRNLGE
jgi:glyoxylase-like metal-dependent hydrolase (beta-lactamase superfamily II)